jgi:hypothetical protein
MCGLAPGPKGPLPSMLIVGPEGPTHKYFWSTVFHRCCSPRLQMLWKKSFHCHSVRSEESLLIQSTSLREILRTKPALRMTAFRLFPQPLQTRGFSLATRRKSPRLKTRATTPFNRSRRVPRANTKTNPIPQVSAACRRPGA